MSEKLYGYYFCTKCGYTGPDKFHEKKDGSQCGYEGMWIESKELKQIAELQEECNTLRKEVGKSEEAFKLQWFMYKDLEKEATELHQRLEKYQRVVSECDEYLESNSTINYIGTSSILHRKLKALSDEGESLQRLKELGNE